jgi:transcriptional regulator with XRE-family HTH domain
MTDKWIGERLREWREANGLSIEDVASRTGCPTGVIERIEDDIGYPGLALHQIIEHLISSPPALSQEEQDFVRQVIEARRAGLIVTLIRPATVECGQVAVTFGECDL